MPFRKDSKDNDYRGITPEKFRRLLAQDKIKIRYEWLDPYFLRQMAIIVTYGGLRYGPYNWQSASQEELKHYEGAMLRHIQEYRMGNFIDKDHGQSHMASNSINNMFVDWFRRQHQWGFRNK